MQSIYLTCIFILFGYFATAQQGITKKIKDIQRAKLKAGACTDFIRVEDLPELNNTKINQIFIIRHGEPALEKNKWLNRDMAINYAKMYDLVGVYNFDTKPICLRAKNEIRKVYSSNLQRTIDTAEKTFDQSIIVEPHAGFNEFERSEIKFLNIKLPRQFWSISARSTWILGINKRGIESFSQAKDRSRRAAFFLNDDANNHGKTMLFSHGFINKYIKRYLKKLGYHSVNLKGQKYLGSYYFFKKVN